jgi:hypothetical protein
MGHPVILVSLLIVMGKHECIRIKLIIYTIIWIIWHLSIKLAKELLHLLIHIWVVTVHTIMVHVQTV